MWRIFQCSSLIAPSSARHLLIKGAKISYQNVKPFRSGLRNYFQGNLSSKSRKDAKFNFITGSTIGITLSSGALAHLTLRHNYVLCEAKKTRMAGYREVSGKGSVFNWNLFFQYLRPHIWYLIAAIIGALAVAVLNIQIPQLVGSVVNVIAKFTESKDSDVFFSEMRVPAIKLILMYVGQSVCTFFYIYMLSNLGEKMAYDMKTDLFASILKQDVSFFDEHRTGEIINRLTTDIQDFKSSFKQTVSGGLRAVTQIIGCSISLVMISPHMTFITLLCIPSMVGVGTVFGALLRTISRMAQAQNEKTTAVADEAVSNIRTVRAFAMEDQEIELYENEAKLSMILNESLGFGIGWFQAGTNIFLNGMVLSTLYMGGYLLSSNKLSAGDLMAYLLATQTVQRSLAQISLLFGSVIRGIAAGSRIFDYISLQPTMPLKGGITIPDEKLEGYIEFKNITFAYPTRSEYTVLKNFTLSVPAGKTVAIVGASGNGKSTIVALLERFYDIQKGSITLDGHDIKKLDPSWLRSRALGFISQEPVLFGTTVVENIRYGKPTATDEEVRYAAKLANAHDFITNFPKGYNTMVGERGVTLSGGQKQRIAIARALLKNPPVLLLDEATSALDAESEKIVQSALDEARKGRTVIVIAHRLSTIQNADLIVVLHGGNIVEMGTHSSLLKLKGFYWSLTYQQQQETPAG